MLKKVLLLAGLITMLLLSGTVSCGGAEAEKELAARSAEEQPEPDSSVIRISAEQLYAEFDANSGATFLKYTGKPLEITGVITHIISRLVPSTYYVILRGDENTPANVEALGKFFSREGIKMYSPRTGEYEIDFPRAGVEIYFLREDSEKIALFDQGQKITVRGVWKNLGGLNPAISDAWIIKKWD